MGNVFFCWFGLSDAFEGMKNYILVLTLLLQRRVLSALTHTFAEQTQEHTHTQIIGQQKPWHVVYAGTSLKCMSQCVCVCACVPAPVCASLPFPCHSPPWQ